MGTLKQENSQISSISDDDYWHIVKKSDTTHSPDGTSYWVVSDQVADYIDGKLASNFTDAKDRSNHTGTQPQSSIVALENALNLRQPTEAVVFNPSLDFRTHKVMQHTQTGNITLSLGAQAHVNGSVILMRIVGNSSGSFTISSPFVLLSGSFDNTATNIVMCAFTKFDNGTTYVYTTINQE